MSEKELQPETEPSKAQTETPAGSAVSEPEAPEVTEEDREQAADKPQEEQAAAQPADSSTSSTAPPATAKRTSSWPGWLALLLSIIALAVSGYLFWLNLQQSTQLAEQQTALRQTIDTAVTQSRSASADGISQLQQQLAQLQQQARDDKQNIDELQQRLTRSIQQITAQQGANRNDWLLAEVEYLLRLANQRVLMEQTATGALTLLKSADEILRETDDVGIYEVRKALAADIAALEAVPKLDTEGVFLQLGALNGQVAKLPLVPVAKQHELPELLQQVTPDTVAESWRSDLQVIWNKLVHQFNSLIVIQHRDEPVEPLLSPQQNYYLQQNLHLMLEQAQQALLLRKAVSYQASLDKSAQWIRDYFDQDSSVTQSLLRSLEELKSVDVAPVMPDISTSLKSLKRYLQQMTELKQEAQAQ